MAMLLATLGRRALLQMGTGMVAGALIPAQAAPDQPDTLVIQWNNLLLQVVRTLHPSVPVTSRALAIVHSCMYDAWSAYDDTAHSLYFGRVLRRPALERTIANKQAALSYAAYHALLDLFPSQAALFATFMTTLGYNPQVVSYDLLTPLGIGMLVAKHILAVRHRDGSNQLGDLHAGAYSDYSGYQPVNGPDHVYDPNLWQPLRITTPQGSLVQQCVNPFWEKVQPFALRSSSQFRPATPARYPHALYRQQAEQLISYSANLTDRQKVIAEYWLDGTGSVTPPGHWCLIAQYVASRDGYDLDQCVKLFFTLTNALLDASIACWDAKMTYQSERPITAIRSLFAGKSIVAWAGPQQGTRPIDGAAWLPYQPLSVVTPAFPEQCSGHSTFSAASAEILRRFTASDFYGASATKFAGSSNIEPGTTPARAITLSWATFSQAAQEAGISRLYGGIHFAAANSAGQALGLKVATQVWHKTQAYINGNF